MMKKMNLKALTLMEAVISTVVVSIMLMGIFSSTLALQRNNENYSGKYLVSATAVNIANHVIQSAERGIGDVNNPGAQNVLTIGGVGWALKPTFCIHQDLNNPPQPQNVNTHIWACYSQFPATGDFYYCTWPYVSGAALRGAQGCTTNDTYVGTMVPGTVNPANPAINCSAFTFTAITRVFPLQAANPATNPEARKTLNMIMASHTCS